MIRYSDVDVLTAARARIAFIFDSFESIIVSVSGGKDSTVVAHLALEEAARRNRKVGLFFLDEEVVYQSTVDQVEYLMALKPESTNRLWLQVEFNLTNAVSLTGGYLRAWEHGKHKKWMRPKGARNILAAPWDRSKEVVRNREKGLDFYSVLDNFEGCYGNTAFLVGLRAVESPNRWRAMVKNPVSIGGESVYWATARQNGQGNVSMYPIYDWNFSDVWRYIGDHGVRYSRIYDYQFMRGMGISEIRCSSLIHEKSFRSICEMPEFEPKTYERLLARVDGISFAQEAGKSASMFRASKLPSGHASWSAYRDFLLLTYPGKPEWLEALRRRFARHFQNEHVARQQCRQLILNDWENNLPIRNEADPREALIKHYMEAL